MCWWLINKSSNNNPKSRNREELSVEPEEDQDPPEEREEEVTEMSGSQSPSWEDWLRPEKSALWMRSSEWLSPSRSPRSSITSWLLRPTRSSRKRLSRLSQSRSRPRPVREPDSNPTSSLETERDTSDWDGSATRKSRELSRELLRLPSLTSSQSERGNKNRFNFKKYIFIFNHKIFPFSFP